MQATAAGNNRGGKDEIHVGSKVAEQYCEICGITIMAPTIQSTATLQESSEVESKTKGKRYCESCQIWCSTGGKCWTEHINGHAHRSKAAALVEQNLASAEQEQGEKVDSITDVKNQVVTSGGNNGSNQTTKDKVQIAVHDTSSGMITFQQSIGGKSGHDDILSEFEHLLLCANQAADELAMSLFLPKVPKGGALVKTKEMALFKASTIGSYSGGALFGHLFPSQCYSSAGQIGDGGSIRMHHFVSSLLEYKVRENHIHPPVCLKAASFHSSTAISSN